MSLPPGFLDDLRDRVAISDVVARHVAWDARRSNPSRGDFWAPCPFHNEKTASFHVDDSKGFYHCFGCHAKGDAINFLKEQEGLSFMEAVEQLAGIAGLQMPAPDPVAARRAEARKSLSDVIEKALRLYQSTLHSSLGYEARSHLEARGLDSYTIQRFELGYAPEERGWLQKKLRLEGISDEEMQRAGLTAISDRGGAPYERFRQRIMFPIRNVRGQAIGFGGRALAAEARAKYLNSPETELFDKGASLYHHGPAREAVAKGEELILAEGYMDVIALVRAGYAGTVAPLGTAVTDRQLATLWKMSSNPVILFDGDSAGQAAASRLADLALPHISPDRSLQFILLSGGEDPDDLFKKGGKAAVSAALDKPLPLVDFLWGRAQQDADLKIPEGRARFEAGLAALTSKINDTLLKRHYDREFKNRAWQLLRGRTVSSAKATQKGVEPKSGEAVVLACAILHPDLLEEYHELIAELSFSSEEEVHLRERALNAILAGEFSHFRESIKSTDEFLNLMARPEIRACPAIRKPGDIELSRAVLKEFFQRYENERGLKAEIGEAVLSAEEADEATIERVNQANERLREVFSMEEQGGSADTLVAKNGFKIDSQDKEGFDSLARGITFTKQKP